VKDLHPTYIFKHDLPLVHLILGLVARTEIFFPGLLQQNVEDLIEAGNELVEEQAMVMKMKLSEEYMKKQTGPGIGLSMS